MNLSVLIFGISLIGVSSVANAADLVIYEKPISSAHDWSGLYLGVNGGYGSGTVDWTGDLSINGVGDDILGSFDASGWLLGVQAGANMQFDNIVVGVEGDIDWANISGEGPEIDVNSSSPSVPSGTLDWLGTLRGRAGFTFDNVLLYGTAGFAFGGGTMSFINAGATLNADASYTGWTAGFGAEIALDDNISLKAEYLYANLTADDVDFGPIILGDLTADSTFGVSTIKVGLNFGF